MNKYTFIFINFLILLSVQKTRNLIISLYRELQYYVTTPSLSYYDNNHSTFPILDNNTNKLVIMLHGLHASPGQFVNHIKYYNNNVNETIKIYTPFIKDTGHTSLENSTTDILNIIQQNIDFIIQNNVKLIFVGLSNGGRIAVNIMNILNSKYNNLDMYLTILGSPVKSSMCVTLLQKLYLVNGIRYPYKELIFNNTLLTEQFNKIIDITIKTPLYSSVNDILAFPISVCTLKNHDNIIVDGYGHNYLVTLFFKDQMNWIYNL